MSKSKHTADSAEPVEGGNGSKPEAGPAGCALPVSASVRTSNVFTNRLEVLEHAMFERLMLEIRGGLGDKQLQTAMNTVVQLRAVYNEDERMRDAMKEMYAARTESGAAGTGKGG